MRDREPVRPRTLAERLAIAAEDARYVTRAHLRPLWRWRIPIRRLRPAGSNGSPGGPVLVVAGMTLPVRYFVMRLLGNEWTKETLGTAPLLGLPKALHRFDEGADMVIARVPRPASTWFFDDAYLHVPEGVDAWVEVPEDTDALARRSTRARRNTNLVIRNALSWTLSVAETDFDVFFDEFHAPFVTQRHTEQAVVSSRKTLRRLFRRGFLLWIHDGEKRLAGAVLEPDGDVLRWWVMGAKTDGVDPVKSGALSAVYVFGIECARKYGFRWFDVGWSPASLRDGVLSHKASWGAVLQNSPLVDHDILFRWEHLDARLLKFLEENPLIFRDGPGLSALAALPSDVSPDLVAARAAYRKLAMPGLHRFYLVSSSGWSRVPTSDAADSAETLWLAEPSSSLTLRQRARPAPGGGAEGGGTSKDRAS